MEVESSICLSDLVPALRWSRPQQVAEALGDPRLPAGWWHSVPLPKALGMTGLDWICERLARLAASRWDHLPLSDLLPALTVHHIDPALPGWPDATRTAITGLGGWQRLRRLSPSDLGTPSATPEVVIGSVFREILGRIPAQAADAPAAASPTPAASGHPEVTRPLQRGQGVPSGAFPAQDAPSGPVPAQDAPSGPVPAPGDPAAQQPAAQTSPYAAQGDSVGGPATGDGSGSGTQSGPLPQRPAASLSGDQQRPGALPPEGAPGSRQTGGFPATSDGAPGPRQTGSFPAVSDPAGSRQTGSFPAAASADGPSGADPRTSGAFPAAGGDARTSGTFPAAGGDARTSGSFPVPPGSRTTGSFPAASDPRQTGSFPGVPGDGQRRPEGAPGPRQTGSFPAVSDGAPGSRQTGGFPAVSDGAPGSRQTGSFPAVAGNGAPGAGQGGGSGLPQRPVPGQQERLPQRPTRQDTGAPGGAAASAGGPHTGSLPAVPGTGGPAKRTPAYAGSGPAPTDPDHAMVRVVDNLFRNLDKLELAVAQHRLFAEDPVSLRTLAHKLLVEREALSQAQRTAEERVLQWLRSSESAPVTGHMFRLTEWLGAAATEEQLIGADPAHPVVVPSLRTPLWRVLVTLMPDRRLQDGWLVVGDLQGLQQRTRQLLASAPPDADPVELLSELGIRAHSAKAWLDALPPETETRESSSAPAPAPAQPLPRRTPGANGHHHRGGQPIPPAAGSIDPSAALATLSALSGGRSPVLSGALAGTPPTPPPPPPSPSADPRRWQRIEVTPEHLRGGPVPVPERYAAQLGMRPGTLLSVTGPGDNAIVLVWQGQQPVFDSLQPVLMRLNARPGDQVYVTVDGYRLEAQLTA
ncbi:hypothetical protein AB0K67_31820 [Nonomuraea sp. NPDC052634]|uniref:hypothetical protein n=1 Tax=Nonomuraea sp. NPDC052634 TaxID=3155813 RepID=UPI0034447564